VAADDDHPAASGDTSVDTFTATTSRPRFTGPPGWLKRASRSLTNTILTWPTGRRLLSRMSPLGKASSTGRLGQRHRDLLYRTDFFEEAGVKPPTTWDELLTVGKALTKGEDATASV